MFKNPPKKIVLYVYVHIYICLFHSCKLTWLAGKRTGWRCISYWKWGYSVVVLMSQSVIYMIPKNKQLPPFSQQPPWTLGPWQCYSVEIFGFDFLHQPRGANNGGLSCWWWSRCLWEGIWLRCTYIYSMIYLQYMSIEHSWIQFGEWFFLSFF